MVYIIKIGKMILQMLYFVMKFLPINEKKVLFLSRQSNELSLDFLLLQDELLRQNPEIKIVAICNRLDDKKEGKIRFAINALRSMYHLATTKVCVLDAYWPVVSILKHKKELTVIQMWHALGKIKQSGYQTIGKESGRSAQISELLCMHKNYDIIIAGGEAWNPFYVASFNTTVDKLVNIGLPRIDYLLETAEANRNKVLDTYPELKDKIVILYAPTFRRNIELRWEGLLEGLDYEKYAFIIKGHPNQQINPPNSMVMECKELTTAEVLAACDYLITDYSAIAVEAAILNKKTYYYLYDFEEYTEKNGINVSPFDSMPGCAYKNADKLMENLKAGEYNEEALEKYREKYLPENLGTSTKQLADIILGKL